MNTKGKERERETDRGRNIGKEIQLQNNSFKPSTQDEPGWRRLCCRETKMMIESYEQEGKIDIERGRNTDEMGSEGKIMV